MADAMAGLHTASDEIVSPGTQPSPSSAATAPTPLTLEIAWTALRRGRQPVLAPGRLALPLGAAVGLVGVNGAGKSTLFMALAGVLAGSCGRATATHHGVDVATVGYVPQRPALAPWLSVRGALSLQGVDASSRLAASPVAPFLTPLLDRRADSLSGGQLQLAAVAATLARQDPLVLLDEPFAGIDIRHRSALMASVSDHRRQNPRSVIILASHLVGDLNAICDWLVVLVDGAVVFAGPRHELPRTTGQSRMDGAAGGDAIVADDAVLLESQLAALLVGCNPMAADLD